MRLQHMKIGYLLGASFGSGVVALLITVAIAIGGMASVQKRLDVIVNEGNRQSQNVNQLVLATLTESEAMRTLPLLQDEQLMAEQKRRFDAATAQFDSAWREVESILAAKGERQTLDKVAEARKSAYKINREIVQLALGSRLTEATDLILNQAGAATTVLMDKLTALRDSSTQDAYQAASSARRWATTVMAVISAIMLVASIAAAWFVTRAVTKPLGEAVRIAGIVAQGDLRQEIRAVGQGETGDVLRALQKMSANLAQVVASVRAGARKLSSVAMEVFAGSSELSSRTEETASSLQQTAASMEELSAAVMRNADHARQAAALAQSATDTAGRGGSAFAEIVNNMSAIDQSAKRIVDIIAVMDGIAFQTNILALNAAVEAARAGENGRGFAVVASEVRALAQRSATAAKEIKALIGDSVQRIEAGGRVVQNAAKTISEIVSTNRQVSEIVGEIALASTEQSEGIGQVKSAIEQMDDVTQRNAGLVEELTAAADSMTTQVDALAKGVDFFKITTQHQAEPSRERARSGSLSGTSPANVRIGKSPQNGKALAPPGPDDSEWQSF